MSAIARFNNEVGQTELLLGRFLHTTIWIWIRRARRKWPVGAAWKIGDLPLLQREGRGWARRADLGA